MQCGQFETRLNELLDERLSPELDPAIQWHARECGQCGALLAAHEVLLFGVEALELPALKPELAERVAAEVTRGRNSVPRSRNWWLPAAAAALLLGIGAWHWAAVAERIAPERLAGERPMLPRANSALAGQTDSQLPTAPTDSSVASSRSRLVSVWLTKDTEQLTEDFGVRQRLLMEQMADGLKPVTDSMSAALQALRRRWPGNEAGSRSS